MNFATYSKKELSTDCSCIRENHILISIQSIGNEVVISDTVYRKGLLKLQFNDVDNITDNHDYFTYAQAEEILNFVERYANQVSLIAVQCEAGISRSVAIASALSKILNNVDDVIFNKGVPNMFVYSTLLEAYFCEDNIKRKWPKIWYLRSNVLKQTMSPALYRLAEYKVSKNERVN